MKHYLSAASAALLCFSTLSSSHMVFASEQEEPVSPVPAEEQEIFTDSAGLSRDTDPSVDELLGLASSIRITAVVNKKEYKFPLVNEGLTAEYGDYTIILKGSIAPYVAMLQEMPEFAGKQIVWDRSETIQLMFSRNASGIQYMGSLTFFSAEVQELPAAPEGIPSFDQIGKLYGVLEYGGYMNPIEITPENVIISEPFRNSKDQSCVTVTVMPEKYLTEKMQLIPEKSNLEVVCTWNGTQYAPEGAFILAAEDIPVSVTPATPSAQEISEKAKVSLRVLSNDSALADERILTVSPEQILLSDPAADQSGNWSIVMSLKNPESFKPDNAEFRQNDSILSAVLLLNAEQNTWSPARGWDEPVFELVYVRQSAQPDQPRDEGEKDQNSGNDTGKNKKSVSGRQETKRTRTPNTAASFNTWAWATTAAAVSVLLAGIKRKKL